MSPEHDLEAVVRRMTTDFRYSEVAARVAIRARFKCEYRSLDMLSSAEAYHWNFNLDHMIPRSAGGTDTKGNLALSCMLCNQLKSGWDPLAHVQPTHTREELIAAARRHVQTLRVLRLREITELRALVEPFVEL